jgi:hypothetical protein
MTKQKHFFIRRPLFRWLAATGAAAALLVPFSANAQNNDVVEVLASAAVAYVIVDAVGGFDDKDRKHRKHHKHQKVHYRHDRYRHDRYRHAKPRKYDRHFGYRHDHRRYRHDHRRYRHDYRHDRRHAHGERRGHWKDQARGKGRQHDRKADHRGHKERYRRIAYH